MSAEQDRALYLARMKEADAEATAAYLLRLDAVKAFLFRLDAADVADGEYAAAWFSENFPGGAMQVGPAAEAEATEAEL